MSFSQERKSISAIAVNPSRVGIPHQREISKPLKGSVNHFSEIERSGRCHPSGLGIS